VVVGFLAFMNTVVWITRTHGEATAEAVIAMGHEALLAPLLAVQPIAANLSSVSYDALIFTSRNGVSAFAQQSDNRDLPVWCVGDATAAQARAHGFTQTVSAGGDAHDLFEKLKTEAPRSTRFLYAAPREPSAPLAAWMWAEGFAVSQVAIYATIAIPPALSDADLRRVTHILIHSARAGRALASHLIDHSKFAFTNSCFICISEKAWQGFAGAIEEQDANLLTGVKARISPLPDELSMLKLIEGDAI
jgi:uroporphyrinogen-III synthase